MTLTLLPIKTGSVALPTIALVWDRGINNSITVFEAGQGSAHSQSIFIHPV